MRKATARVSFLDLAAADRPQTRKATMPEQAPTVGHLQILLQNAKELLTALEGRSGRQRSYRASQPTGNCRAVLGRIGPEPSQVAR